ncbi:hypothetical protein D9615_000852 [Tricholomella constricta]|uniref:Uncharacterized protein n=1 Tax=Tricholomella constricta TaxID=117010 RepID=A0A8H5HRL7_9AGAR|nr:hypothetical protein D9615_000852 [Tricholomella constricta]
MALINKYFWNLVTGFHSDHAEDQKKLFKLLKEWKERCEREKRGERTVKRFIGLELVAFLFKCTQNAIRKAGGPIGWEKLSEKERLARYNEMRMQVIRDIGQQEFGKLSDKEKEDVDFFLWAGCCMHKEMNAFKGGVHQMEQFWPEHSLAGPKKMYNRDNDVTVQKAPGTEASKRAEDITKGGAVKVASLCGAIFRHKDRKRGQQDTLRFFFDLELGFIISFPDTNNTRFQSHAEACAVLITYLDLFIKFLTFVKENKASRKLNHMEQNVWDGLHCNATRHEIVVITLYWLVVSVPYMREIRGPFREHDNILKLGNLHRRVISHLDKLIANPELIVGLDASWKEATLDGKMWERSEAFYGAQRYAPELPHLKELMVAFLCGARVTWLRFMSEFADDGALAKATPEQIERAWMESTNDLCESAFGMFRQDSKANPNISLEHYNARKMFKFNGTSEFLRKMGPEMRAFLRRVTRTQDASGANRQMKLHLAKHRQETAEKKLEKSRVRKAKENAAADALAQVIPTLTITELEYMCSLPRGAAGYATIAALDLQLDWHIKHGAVASISKKGPQPEPPSKLPVIPNGKQARGDREAKINLLRAAVESYLEHKHDRAPVPIQEGSTDAPEDEYSDKECLTVDDLEAYNEEVDSEDDYYQ